MSVSRPVISSLGPRRQCVTHQLPPQVGDVIDQAHRGAPRTRLPASRSPFSNTLTPRTPATRSLTSGELAATVEDSRPPQREDPHCWPPWRYCATDGKSTRCPASLARHDRFPLTFLVNRRLHRAHEPREPILIPSAPSAQCGHQTARASANPPEAIIGMSILTAGRRDQPPGRECPSSPGWPGALRNPSMLMPSHPQASCAFNRMPHRGALVQHLDPVVVKISGRCGAGLDPAVPPRS